MAHFYYTSRAESEPSVYVRRHHLAFTLNCLYSGDVMKKMALIDNVLCHLSRDFVVNLWEELRKEPEYMKLVVKDSESGEDNDPLAFPEPERLGQDEHFDYGMGIAFISKWWQKPIGIRLAGIIFAEAQRVLKQLEETDAQDDIFSRRMDELKGLFSLDNMDLKILFLFFLADKDNAFMEMCEFSELTFFAADFRRRLLNVRTFTGMNIHDIRKRIVADAPLIKYNLIDRNGSPCYQLCDFLEGVNDKPLSSYYFTEFKGEAVDLALHHSMEKHVRLISDLVRTRGKDEPLNILLYGEPGTGKTEFCRSLAKKLGLRLYDVNKMPDGEGVRHGDRFRFSAIKACQNSVDPADSILVVDEADEMLNGFDSFSLFLDEPFASPHNPRKDILNDVLDSSKCACIWISNRVAYMEDSTLRRFDYSVKFRKFSFEQRRQIWGTCAAKHGLQDHFSDGELSKFSKKYEINVGGIDLALKNYKRIISGSGEVPGPETREETIESILAPHVCLLNGDYASKNDKPVKGYSLEGLNIKGDCPISETIGVLSNFSKYLSETGKPEVRNMNLLLHGPPGTGKTEFAKFAAEELGREFIARRASDLLSMYVGGTEKLIRKAFAEAEHSGGMLFIDEADSLFLERDKAFRSYETSMVNELLSCMESFVGILVCATNHKRNFDSASIRRFNLKVEFDYLKPEGALLFYRRCLQDLSGAELSSEETRRLCGLGGLTPGDFKVVRQKNLFMPKGRATNSSLITALCEEVEYRNGAKSKKIGF